MQGGGIWCWSSDPTITNCLVTGNSADSGGGIYCYSDADATITGCTINGNEAGTGGGVYGFAGCDLTIKSCSITDNTASDDHGGGCFFSGSQDLTFINCLIAGNTADNNGGGIYCYYDSDPTITNCTIADNSAVNGGGLYLWLYINATVNNSIVWSNDASTNGDEFFLSGATAILHYSCYGNSAGDVYTYVSTFTATDNCSTSDPSFVGGSPYDYRLAYNSPCYGSGNNNYVTETYDVEGNWRIIRDTVDKGAYEYGVFKDTASDRSVRGPSSGADNVVWGDFNGDGHLDAYVVKDGGSNIMYINDGDNTFTDCTSSMGVSGPTYSRGACAADYDNDGHLDLLVCNDGGNLYLYHYIEEYGFSEVASSAGLTGFTYSVMATWGDYDNDGYLDLYVVQSQGNCKLFQNDGDGTFTDTTSTAGVSGPASGSSAIWCDINNDNLLDLYVVGTVTDSAKLYNNNGDGTFTDISSSSGANVEGGAATAGDFDNDGDFDIFVAKSGGSNYLLRNNFVPNETLTFTDVASSAGVTDPTYAVDCCFVDFDNDSDLDLYVTASDANHEIYCNTGMASFTKFDQNKGGTFAADARGVASLDLLGDGKQCFYVVRNNSYSELYEQRVNDNNWISFALEPSVSNKSGIGTRIQITFDAGEWGNKMTRTVSGGSGWGSQGPNTLCFGLGTMTKDSIYSIDITWPSGICYTILSDDYNLNETYYCMEDEWRAWPGGYENNAMNPLEELKNTDFGFKAIDALDWDVDEGTPDGVIVWADGEEVSPVTSIQGKKKIRVRYGEVSSNNQKENAVQIQAKKPGGNPVTHYRTVFKATWSFKNSGSLDNANLLEFSQIFGNNPRTCELLWDGDSGSDYICAKIECKATIQPTGIDWTARGVTFTDGDATTGSKGNCRAWRQKQGVISQQLTGVDTYRVLEHYFKEHQDDRSKWDQDGSATKDTPEIYGDVQYPTCPQVTDKNVIYRIDAPFTDAGARKQLFYRVDLVESLQWYDGWSGWVLCSDYGAWHINITGKLPDCAKDTEKPNGTGSGQTSEKAPNQPPYGVGIQGDNPLHVTKGQQGVSMTATSSDPDQDEIPSSYFDWEQESGPTVTLNPSSGNGQTVTFDAPNQDCTLVFKVWAHDGTCGLDRWAPGNHLVETPGTMTVIVGNP